jgi:hypothetical protein
MNSLISVLLGAAFAVFACSTATARIGETLEACKERYGEVTVSTPAPEYFPEGSTMHGFKKAGMTISVTIHDSKVVQIMFWKNEEDATGNPQPLDDVEIRTLLNANSDGQSWDSAPASEVPPDTQGWYTKIGDLVVLASFATQASRLTLITLPFSRLIATNKEDKSRSSLEGF